MEYDKDLHHSPRDRFIWVVILVPKWCEYLCRQGLNKHFYYPTQQNTSSRFSEEFKAFLSSVTKHYNFQERASSQGLDTYHNFTSWNLVYENNPYMCMIHAGTPLHEQSSPKQLPPLSKTEYSVLWKIPLRSPRPCPVIRNVLFLMVTDKITVWTFVWGWKPKVSEKVQSFYFILL